MRTLEWHDVPAPVMPSCKAALVRPLVVSTVDVQRVGARLAFANCYLHCGDQRLARASAVFANTGGE
jgi:hypothetical protein